MKRVFAVLLAVLMIVALVGCGKEKREVIKLTLSTEDAEAILAAAGIMLPEAESVSCAGSVVKWYAWYDSLQNYSEDEIVNTGYFTFNEKYGAPFNGLSAPGTRDSTIWQILFWEELRRTATQVILKPSRHMP